MSLTTEKLRFTLGLKVRRRRTSLGQSLKEVAGVAGMSVSYLSEIEKGKKYPKPEKLLDLALALGTSYDELVSLKVEEELNPLTALFDSSFVQEFPFELFGLATEDLVNLVTDEPQKAGALVRAFLEIGRTYDVQVEHFLFAALRSYQQMHDNSFEDLELAAERFREEHGLADRPIVRPEDLLPIFAESYGFGVDEQLLAEDATLSSFRSVLREKPPANLFINGRLLPSQKAFVLGREIGYRYLGLDEQALSSSWLKVESFEQVLNNFKASYFAGAVLLSRKLLETDLKQLLGMKRWDPDRIADLMDRYDATPEMFSYRLTQIIPKAFGLKEIYFMRFSHEVGEEVFHLTKLLNMSRVPVPHGVGLDEHYCRRWAAVRLLRELGEAQTTGEAVGSWIRGQRVRFVDEDAEFFVVSMARPLSLRHGANSCVSLGFLMDPAFKRQVKFASDADLGVTEVNLTCERCGLADCNERVAPATVSDRQRAQQQKEHALANLLYGDRS